MTALWPVLWQRRLKDVENAGIDVLAMGGWAARVLCPLGPYPALRVEDVPYGVLPAVDLSAWVSRPHDPGWEHALLTILAGGVLSAWAAAGVAGGTAAGADVDGLLEIIGRVPTARALGSQLLLPFELLALLRAVAFGESPQEVLATWKEDGAAVLGLSPEPLRRYWEFGYVQPAVRGHGSVRDLLRRYLHMSWEELAYGGHEVADRSPFLVRLLRHSLLLTQAEVVAAATPTTGRRGSRRYLAPAGRDARAACADAGHGSRVDELPDVRAGDRLDEQTRPTRACSRSCVSSATCERRCAS